MPLPATDRARDRFLGREETVASITNAKGWWTTDDEATKWRHSRSAWQKVLRVGKKQLKWFRDWLVRERTLLTECSSGTTTWKFILKSPRR